MGPPPERAGPLRLPRSGRAAPRRERDDERRQRDLAERILNPTSAGDVPATVGVPASSFPLSASHAGASTRRHANVAAPALFLTPQVAGSFHAAPKRSLAASRMSISV